MRDVHPKDRMIRYEEYEDGKIGCLTLQRIERLNAIDGSFLDELHSFFSEVASKENVSILIVHSSLPQAFCAGIDVKDVKGRKNEQTASFFQKLAVVLDMITKLPQLTIAAVNGIAYGAGADIAVACDYRIANRALNMRFPGPQFGVILGTHRLVSEIGPSKARQLLLTNQQIKGEQALWAGLMHEISKEEDSLQAAFARAKEILRLPNYSFQQLLKICSHEREDTLLPPDAVAKKSVLHGDFQERFSQYVKRIKKDN